MKRTTRLAVPVCAMLLGIPAPLLRIPDTMLQQIRVMLQPEAPQAARPAIPPRRGLAWHHPASPT